MIHQSLDHLVSDLVGAGHFLGADEFFGVQEPSISWNALLQRGGAQELFDGRVEESSLRRRQPLLMPQAINGAEFLGRSPGGWTRRGIPGASFADPEKARGPVEQRAASLG